ncbi:hypothetical protein LTR84_010530 [Exophiala bonariae]|uniref:Xylose isomerase-like TIM barrel domain-containing protein n=1 Tax=Exophiala bonariae TaxID=1690606 RepID=A0AAV9MWN8_9EURO|nr:hypothetical protein LTR84_010530 [Exophiala bonariae]
MIRPAIASVSLGRASAGHDIIQKLHQASLNGFEGVEIFFECLEALASTNHKVEKSPDKQEILDAATEVHRKCKELNLKVVCLQPFLYFEGLLDETQRQHRLEDLVFWFEICEILETDLVQIASNFQPHGTTGNVDHIVADLSTAATLGSQRSYPIRFAYEAISWGTHIDTWEQAWEIITRVNLPNFGMCLDTFHIAGRVWADPTSEQGLNPDADHELDQSLRRLVAEMDPRKIFYVQLSDAERLRSPMRRGHPLYQDSMKPRMLWSRNARLFPFEDDRRAYLPIWKICYALFVEMKWEGWVSEEVFHKSLYTPGDTVVSDLAKRAKVSWDLLDEKLSLAAGNSQVRQRERL